MNQPARKEQFDAFANQPGSDALRLAYSLSIFAMHAVFTEDYEVSPQWQEIISLSEEGQGLLNSIKESAENLPLSDLYFALFRRFYHHGLLIDHASSDLTSIQTILNDDLFSGKLKWPYKYGRFLYDKYNDHLFTGPTEYISTSDLALLLTDSPQGVYQVGNILSGPLGFLESQEKRFVPPIASLLLWHCSDTGCQEPHSVQAIQPNIPPVMIYRLLDEVAKRELGHPSDLNAYLLCLLRDEDITTARKYYDLPVFIADSILGTERRNLVERGLSGKSAAFLREVIGLPPRKKATAYGSPEDVANRLSPEEQLQLLLTLTDSELINLIDDCVISGAIQIPAKEVRRARQLPPKLYYADSRSELSALGLRSNFGDPVIALTSLIWDEYEKSGNLNELDWRLRTQPGVSTGNALMGYIRQNSPSVAIRNLILSSEPVTKAIANKLNLLINAGDDEVLTPRLLWKMGFTLPRFEDKYDRLRKRLDRFKETIIDTGSITREEDREAVRSAGVNLFVSIEEILEELLVYNIWLLSSDHLLKTNYTYNHSEARKSISRVLGAELTIDGIQFRWNVSGENPLGTLLNYLQQACNWMQSLPSKDPAALLRPIGELPHYIHSLGQRFPFLHTELWADCNHRSLVDYVEEFTDIAKQVIRSNLAGIRNGLDHKRDDQRFPTIENMLAFATRFKEAFDRADIKRFIPKSYWLETERTDLFGQVEYIFSDYAGRRLVSYGPHLIALTKPPFGRPLLLAPGDLLGLPNSYLRFLMTDNSVYSEYWKDYPRRIEVGVDESEGPTDDHTTSLEAA